MLDWFAHTGLGRYVREILPGPLLADSLQRRLLHCGLSALRFWQSESFLACFIACLLSHVETIWLNRVVGWGS